MLKSILILMITILPPLALSAGSIQRVEDGDGIVEFTNVTTTKKSPGKQTIIYKYPQSADKVIIFTDRKPLHITDYEVLKFDCFACDPDSTINWQTVKLNLSSYAETINILAKQSSVDPALIRALIHAESAFKVNAVSSQGAQGLMQLMPKTAEYLGVKNSFDAKQNIGGGIKYIAELLKTFNGDVKLATAAYNAGPTAVRKYNGIPPYRETKVYVKRVGI